MLFLCAQYAPYPITLFQVFEHGYELAKGLVLFFLENWESPYDIGKVIPQGTVKVADSNDGDIEVFHFRLFLLP